MSPKIRLALSSNEVPGKESMQTPEPADQHGDDVDYPKLFVVAQVVVSDHLGNFLVALVRPGLGNLMVFITPGLTLG